MPERRTARHMGSNIVCSFRMRCGGRAGRLGEAGRLGLYSLLPGEYLNFGECLILLAQMCLRSFAKRRTLREVRVPERVHVGRKNLEK